MKEYQYIYAEDIGKYNDWEVVASFSAYSDETCDIVIVMREDKPIQGYIKLHEATPDELLNELKKRLGDK